MTYGLRGPRSHAGSRRCSAYRSRNCAACNSNCAHPHSSCSKAQRSMADKALPVSRQPVVEGKGSSCSADERALASFEG
jgi:hypothetical protein